MGDWLLHSRKGYVTLILTGYSPERFLNLCAARGIELWGVICRREGGWELQMLVEDYRTIRPLARKAGVRLHILRRRGLPFFLARGRKRWYYAAGILAFFGVLYGMSCFLWSIGFEGNYRYTSDTLSRYMDTLGIRCGILRAQVDCGKLEEALRMQFPELTWVSASLSGTRLLVRVKENEVLSAIPGRDETPCDIVASQSGRITEMVVRSGTPAVKVGDEVAEGQVLIYGTISITGDDGQELRSYGVRADGEVKARTVHTYEREYPLAREYRTPAGRRRRGWYLKAGPWSAAVLLPPGLLWRDEAREARQWDYAMEERQLRLFENLYLPLYIGDIHGAEMEIYERGYTPMERNALAEAVNQGFVRNLEEKGVQIIENNDRIETSLSGWRITGELVTEESIIRRQPLSGETGDSSEETEQNS